MPRKIPFMLGLTTLVATTAVAWAQIESTLPRKSAQPREAIQPSTTNSPSLKSKPILDRQPRLTDGATDEHGNEIDPRDDTAAPTEVLTNRPRSNSVRSRNPDLVMATWIALVEHQEIALAELAADRAHKPAVRQYAEASLKRHETFLSRLRPYAPEAISRDYLKRTVPQTASNTRTETEAETEAVVVRSRVAVGETPATVGPVIDRLADGKPPERDLEPSATRTEQDRPRLGAETAPIVRIETRTVTPVGRDFNVVQVERELALQSLISSQEMLAHKTGPDFDEWFLAREIGAHKALRDQLIVYQRYVSNDLGKLLAAEELATADQLAQANELLGQVSNPVAVPPLPKK